MLILIPDLLLISQQYSLWKPMCFHWFLQLFYLKNEELEYLYLTFSFPILFSNADFFMILHGEEDHKKQELIHALPDSVLF